MQLQPLNKPKAISALKANFSLNLIILVGIELQQKSQLLIVVHVNMFFPVNITI